MKNNKGKIVKIIKLFLIMYIIIFLILLFSLNVSWIKTPSFFENITIIEALILLSIPIIICFFIVFIDSNSSKTIKLEQYAFELPFTNNDEFMTFLKNKMKKGKFNEHIQKKNLEVYFKVSFTETIQTSCSVFKIKSIKDYSSELVFNIIENINRNRKRYLVYYHIIFICVERDEELYEDLINKKIYFDYHVYVQVVFISFYSKRVIIPFQRGQVDQKDFNLLKRITLNILNLKMKDRIK